MYNHMTMAHDLLDADPDIRYSMGISQNIGNMAEIGVSADMKALQDAYAEQWSIQLRAFYRSGMRFVPLFYFQWMFVFQQFYMAIFASRTHRIMKFFQFEFMLDVIILFTDMCYLVIILRDYRFDTFLKDLYPMQEA